MTSLTTSQSVPMTNMASAAPAWRMRKAWPSESSPELQPEVVVWIGPRMFRKDDGGGVK